MRQKNALCVHGACTLAKETNKISGNKLRKGNCDLELRRKQEAKMEKQWENLLSLLRRVEQIWLNNGSQAENGWLQSESSMDSSMEHFRHREQYSTSKWNNLCWKRARCVPDTGGRPRMDDSRKDGVSGIRRSDAGRNQIT